MMRASQITVDSSAAIDLSTTAAGGRSDTDGMLLQVLTGAGVWVGFDSGMVAAPAAGNNAWYVPAGAIFNADRFTGQKIWLRAASGVTALVNVLRQGA